jgi:hypothetical protein
MKVILYTNSLIREKITITERCLVADEKLGKQLVENWNRLAEPFNYFEYKLVGFEPSTKEDEEKLGCYDYGKIYTKPRKP